MEKFRKFRGHGPQKTGAALVRDARTGSVLFIMCFYDPPLKMGEMLMGGEEPSPDVVRSGGDLIRRGLRRRGLNPDNFAVSVFEAADTSLV